MEPDAYIVTPCLHKTWRPTLRLRFVKREPDNGDGSASVRHALQQAWVAQETGEIEWRDVPVEDEGG